MLQAILDIVLSSDRSTASAGTSSYPYGEAENNPGDGDINSRMWLDNNLDMDFWMNLEDHPWLAWPDLTVET